jgi:hypothetical protein
VRELGHRGVGSLVVLIEANTFGPAGSSRGVTSALTAYGISMRRIRCGDDLSESLSRPIVI